MIKTNQREYEVPFENANCYGYAWGTNYNFAPGSIGPDRESIDLDGISDVNEAASIVMTACKADGLLPQQSATAYQIAVFINTYEGDRLDYHFYRHGPNKWSHKMSNTGQVEEGINDPVAHNLGLINTKDANDDLIIGQHSCGILYRPEAPTPEQIIETLEG
ncbi:hypothetical protein [Jeongeupia naejangsanensis]|uniref:Uncharacterized protein n=1 Tax=Jeongeupia naejangsanensis TaxID=613195 RepID=A0ABS2BGS0_9NEIS|nr:hypothetical protein [Jeongeupia naejangsanensis]MBM3114807.1 hypothetical protein [Jeongeupia naejangsanensis]